MLIASELLPIVSFVGAFYLIWELDAVLGSTKKRAGMG